MIVIIMLVLENGMLQKVDGSVVVEGMMFVLFEFVILIYIIGKEVVGSVELFGYQVFDEWGGKVLVIVLIIVIDVVEVG